MTHMRIIVNIAVAVLYGAMYDRAGKEGSRVSIIIIFFLPYWCIIPWRPWCWRC